MPGRRRLGGQVAEQKPGAELTATYDNTRAIDGSRKRYCQGCGGLRDVTYAETHPCVACGSLGTVKKMPQFDQYGELIKTEEAAETPTPAPASAVLSAPSPELKAKPPTLKQQRANAKAATASLFRAALKGT